MQQYITSYFSNEFAILLCSVLTAITSAWCLPLNFALLLEPSERRPATTRLLHKRHRWVQSAEFGSQPFPPRAGSQTETVESRSSLVVTSKCRTRTSRNRYQVVVQVFWVEMNGYNGKILRQKMVIREYSVRSDNGSINRCMIGSQLNKRIAPLS